MTAVRRVIIAAVAALAGLLATAAMASAAPPTGVTGMALDNRVELSWQPVAGATAYKVYRGATATTVTTPLMANPFTPPDLSVPASYTDITPVNGTTYFYAVRAITNGVESANSRIVQATPRPRSCNGGNPVTQENCFPGDADWDVGTATGVDGYATAQSIDHGQSVDLKLQAPSSATADIEIFRSGWYGGAGARLFSKMLAVPVGTQPSCLNDGSTGLYDCSSWNVSETLTTSVNWPSGVYLLRVTRRDTGVQTHILVVVRDDQRRAQVLYGVPTSTYQAYNWYGGRSLYDNKSTGAATVSGTPRAVKVSFDRPYQQPHDSAQFDWYTRADYATVGWLERSGYDVSYGASSDLERSGTQVQDHRVFISGTHDEYYSSAMRTALQQARDHGTDLFFTGANEIYWRVRYETSPVSGRQDRVEVCYKSTQSGGPDPSGIPTGTWRDPAGANAPENALAGGMYVGEEAVLYDFFPMKVSAAEGKDRLWRYTGLENQSAGQTATLGTSLLGWEWDARVSNGLEPPGTTTLATSPVSGRILQDAGRVYVNGSTNSHVTRYQAASGALVFSTGTNHWNWGLGPEADDPAEPNAKIQQATTNILYDMGAYPETPMAGMVLDDPTKPPLVTLRNPAPSATQIEPSSTVEVTFSRTMDGTSIKPSTFWVTRPDGSVVSATVSYDDTSFKATLRPTLPLDLNTSFTVHLDASIRAANGIALGAPITWSFTTRPPDTTAPTVSFTNPANGDLVAGSTDVTTTAADNIAVAGVQLTLDGANLGAEDTSAPYTYTWNLAAVSAGTHTLAAVARDTSGNTATASITVTVDPTGLVGAYGFEETSGTTVKDVSGKGNDGTLSNATRSTAGKFGSALSFNGTNAAVVVPDSATLDMTKAITLEAWVNPSAASNWRTVLMKEQPNELVYGLYSNTATNVPSATVYTTSEADTRGTAVVGTGAWTHLAGTYDGATLRLFVNGVEVSSKPLPGAVVTSTGALRIGGNSVWGEWFAGLIDEVRIYRRVLSANEIRSDMTTPVVPPDVVAPSSPGGLVATGGIGQARLTWNAASDNIGVDHYDVFRSRTQGFTPAAANRIAQPTGTSYTDSGLTAGDYYYRVSAVDAAGNSSTPSSEASATATSDTTAPTVTLTAPAAGATVAGAVTLTATANDDVAIGGVQFKVDGTNIATEDTTSPYSTNWDSTSLPNGTHTLTAVARDTSNNTTTSAPITVTTNNAPPDTSGLVAAYGFEETTGTTVTDRSTSTNTGTLSNATRTTAGKFGSALTFNGTNAAVVIPDSNSLDLTNAMTLEAWVNPTATTNWRTVLMKEQTGGMAYALYANTDTNRPSGHVFTTAEVDTRGTAQVAANTWTHLAATYDGATLRLYVNGAQVSSRAVTGSIVASTGSLRLGGNAIWGEWFAGSIDEVRVYKRTLSTPEIQGDMTRAVG